VIAVKVPNSLRGRTRKTLGSASSSMPQTRYLSTSSSRISLALPLKQLRKSWLRLRKALARSSRLTRGALNARWASRLRRERSAEQS